MIAERDLGSRARRTLAVWGMFLALYTLCGFYIHARQPGVISDLVRFASLLTLAIVSVILSHTVNHYLLGSATIVPLLLFGMTAAIAYQQELALLLSACVVLITVVLIGMEFSQALVLMATVTGAILVLRQVRTRGKLLSVGSIAAAVALMTTLGVGTLDGQSWAPLLRHGCWLALWSIVAGSLMTVLLPAAEKVFSVQTDLSLN